MSDALLCVIRVVINVNKLEVTFVLSFFYISPEPEPEPEKFHLLTLLNLSMSLSVDQKSAINMLKSLRSVQISILEPKNYPRSFKN